MKRAGLYMGAVVTDGLLACYVSLNLLTVILHAHLMPMRTTAQ